MMRRIRRDVLAFVAVVAALLLWLRFPGTSPTPIRQGLRWGHIERFTGAPAVPHPIPGPRPPQHPHMATNGANNMHNDSYISDTHEVSGPLGVDVEVRSTARGLLGGECASVTFDRRGRIVTVCTDFSGPELLLLDPRTLAELASYRLPQRPSTRSYDIRTITSDTSGGAYFYLDDHDRAVIATSEHDIRLVAEEEETATGTRFVLERSYDLAPFFARAGWEQDQITTALPDWDGRLWFVTRRGQVGTVDPESGATEVLTLDGEEIENSFAVGEDGVYIVSDHAMYGFRARPDGGPEIVWRAAYDRGTHRKIGMITQGSGTTPTLLGDDFVAIADNAEPRMNALVYRRRPDAAGERLVCTQPVFAPGASATENTVVGFGRSLIIENNAGYDIFPTMMFGRTSAPGVTRIDLEASGQGCHVVWESQEISQTTVPKLSLGNGLLYLYTKDPHAPRWVDAYYLTAVDFRTGATVYRTLAGTGLGYDNHWAPITLGPDGTAYVGTLRGLIAVRDGPAPPLRVGTSGDYPPFSVRTADDAFDGFDVAVARAYAAERRRPLALVPFRWPELAARLAAHDFAVAMSGVTVRPERLVHGAMTATVARSAGVVVVREGTQANPLDATGRTVAVNRGGHLERVARAHLTHATIRTVDDNRTLAALLGSGQVDAVVADALEAATFGPGLVTAALLTRDRKAYWVAPGEEALARNLDAWLAWHEEDGLLAGLRARYLGASDGATLRAPALRLSDLLARRLLLMPMIATAKRAAGLPIEDTAREAEVERAAQASAAAHGLVADAYLALVRAEIAAAKAVQRAATEDDGAPAVLGQELRPAVTRIDAAIVDTLAESAPLDATADDLLAALRADCDLPGLDDETLRPLAAGLAAQAPAAPAAH